MLNNLPSGTITFLFTDIEGSTQLWERYPDAMQAALAWHDELLRRAIESHHGRVVKSTGDGCMAAFASAAEAVAAIIDIQRALQAGSGPPTRITMEHRQASSRRPQPALSFGLERASTPARPNVVTTIITARRSIARLA